MINFGSYKYIGTVTQGSNPNSYKYNADKLQQYISSGQYVQAANYMSQFIPNDRDERTEHFRDIDALRKQGQNYQAMLSKAKEYGPDAYNKFEFITGLKNGINISNNPIYQKYTELKRRLGSSVEYEDKSLFSKLFYPSVSNFGNIDSFTDQSKSKIKNEAEFLEFTFRPNDDNTASKAWDIAKPVIKGPYGALDSIADMVKNKALFTSVSDVLDKNKIQEMRSQGLSDAYIANKLRSDAGLQSRSGSTTFDNLGISEQELKNNGLELVVQKDGSKTLRFNKNNPIADKLIYSYLSNNDIISGRNEDVSVVGYDANGKRIDVDNENIADRTLFNLNQKSINTQMFKILSDSLFDENVINSVNTVNGPREYTSTLAGPIFDELAAVYQGGPMTDEQAKAITPIMAYVYTTLKSLGSEDIEMYTNGLNDDPNITALTPVNNAGQREAILATIADKINDDGMKDVALEACTINGKVGTLITFTGGAKDKQEDINKNTPIDELTNSRRYEVFIPGLFTKEAQAKLDGDTSAIAANEIADMKTYGYGYDTYDNNVISIDKNSGEFMRTYKVNGETITDKIPQSEATRLINKDIILRHAIRDLPYNYINDYGQIVNLDAYKNMAKSIAFKSNFELYPDEPLLDNNLQPYTEETIDDIFETSKVNRENTPYVMWRQINDIRDIYNRLMLELRRFN